MVSRGLATPDIAKELGVTTDTAIQYVARVLHFMKQRGRIEAGGTPELTERETEVVELVQRGATDSEIAAEMSISVRTAEDHVYRILRKFGYHSRIDLVRIGRDGKPPAIDPE